MNGRFALTLILTFSCVAASPASAATTIPGAIAYAAYDYYRFGLGTYDANVRVDGDGSTTLTAESSSQLGVPFVSTVVGATGFVNLRSEAVSAAGYHADGNGALTYSLLVGGSGYTGIVPLHMIANLVVTVTGDGAHVGHADANLYVSQNSIYQWRAALCTSSCSGSQPSSVSIDTVLNVNADQLISIAESVTAEAIDGGTGKAFADPYFEIESTFLAQHPGLTLQFSAFVGNNSAPSAVPEPATWAMTIAGFGLIGAAMRRRKRSAAFA